MSNPNSQTFDVEQDILANASLCSLMESEKFCEELWCAFANITWQKMYDESASVEEQVIQVLTEAGSEHHWGQSFRGMAAVIADIRNQLYNANEDYMDWYCRDSGIAYGYVSDRVRAAMLSIKWIPVEDDYYKGSNP